MFIQKQKKESSAIILETIEKWLPDQSLFL